MRAVTSVQEMAAASEAIGAHCFGHRQREGRCRFLASQQPAGLAPFGKNGSVGSVGGRFARPFRGRVVLPDRLQPTNAAQPAKSPPLKFTGPSLRRQPRTRAPPFSFVNHFKKSQLHLPSHPADRVAIVGLTNSQSHIQKIAKVIS